MTFKVYVFSALHTASLIQIFILWPLSSATIYFYRPQTKFAKVMFLHLSVILFTGGVCLSACWDTTTSSLPPPRTRHTPRPCTHPWDQTPHGADRPGTRHPPTPQEQTPHPSPGSRRLLLRTVHILLECILVLCTVVIYSFWTLKVIIWWMSINNEVQINLNEYTCR